MVARGKPTPRRATTSTRAARSAAPRIALLAIGFAAIVALLSFALTTCIAKTQEVGAVAGSAESQEQRVSFVAVGDNLPEIGIAEYADSLAGETGDGAYDYAPIYEPIKPYVESADLAYMKQETHLGGGDIGPRGYPSFNTTDEMADAVVATGFDLVASATNHSYDWGCYGAVDHSLAVWSSKPVERRSQTGPAFNLCVLRGNIVYSSLVRPSNEEGLWHFALYRSSTRLSFMWLMVSCVLFARMRSALSRFRISSWSFAWARTFASLPWRLGFLRKALLWF